MVQLSIIIPVYNTEKYVRRCIDSCMSQTLNDNEYEIVVVNDGSSDKSIELLTKHYGNKANVIIISQENKGLSGARNTGLKNAKGDYIWFVDSDDWIEVNCLKKITHLCKENELDILQFCAANIINETPQRRFYRRNTGEIVEGKECLKKRFPFCAPFSIYKRDFLINNNLWFYEGIYHEDNEFTPRVYYCAKRVGAIDDVLYYVYQNPNSITRTVNPKKSTDCIVVMNSLDDFSKNVDEVSKTSFSNIITSVMNVALHDTLCLQKKDKKIFIALLKKNAHLFRHLKQSSSWVYRIEGFLLTIFRNNPISIYKLLNAFDYRREKKQEV